jgi:hypothetical protein
MPSQGLAEFLDVAIGETFGVAVNWTRGFLSGVEWSRAEICFRFGHGMSCIYFSLLQLM